MGKIFNAKRLAIKYMKNTMSPDEMILLMQTFYDVRNKRFRSSGTIQYNDGRKTLLEQKYMLHHLRNIGITKCRYLRTCLTVLLL